MRRLANILIPTLLVVLSACTQVKMEDPSAPVTGFVCSLDWSDMDGGKEPKGISHWLSMASTRVTYAQHFFWEDIYYAPHGKDTVRAYAGDYLSTIFLSTRNDAWWVENLPDFLDDRHANLRDVFARLRKPSEASLAEDYPGFDRILSADLDTVPPAPKIWCASLRYHLEEGQVTPLVFKPVQVTQQVTFRITVQAEEDVVPQRLVACISGVPSRVEMMSGQLNTAYTGQTLFDLKPSEEDENVWEATVSLLGILPSEDSGLLTGPGLLTLCAEIGPLHRRFIRVCNLRNYLLQQPLLTATQEEDRYIGGENEVTYTIASPFIIRNEDAPYPEGQDPMEEWKIPEGSETVPIIDGNEEADPDDDPEPDPDPEEPEEPEEPVEPEQEPEENEDETA